MELAHLVLKPGYLSHHIQSRGQTWQLNEPLRGYLPDSPLSFCGASVAAAGNVLPPLTRLVHKCLPTFIDAFAHMRQVCWDARLFNTSDKIDIVDCAERKNLVFNHLDPLLVLRGFACLMIVISHCNPPRKVIFFKGYDLT